MKFEWDLKKADKNLRDHGIDFDDAIHIFNGAIMEGIDQRKDYGETRWRAYGCVDGRLLAVVYTWGGIPVVLFL
jgi:uncharacterized DUF497 family protein